MTQATRGGATAAPAARRDSSDPAVVLERVQEILQETCEQDGQGRNLQETARRKAYRAGINRALEVIRMREKRGEQ